MARYLDYVVTLFFKPRGVRLEKLVIIFLCIPVGYSSRLERLVSFMSFVVGTISQSLFVWMWVIII